MDLIYDNVDLGDALRESRTLYGTIHYINEKKTFMIMTCGIEEKKKLSVWIPADIEIANREKIIEGAVVDVRGSLQIWHERKNELQIKAEYVGLSRLANGEIRESEWINQLKQWQAEYKDEWTETPPPVIEAIAKSKTPVALALGHAYDMHYAAKVASETWMTPTDAIKGINALYFRNTNISEADKIKMLEDEIHNLQQKLRNYEDRGFLAKVWDLFK